MSEGQTTDEIINFINKQKNILIEPFKSEELKISKSATSKINTIINDILDDHFDPEIVKELARRVSNLSINQTSIKLRGKQLINCAYVLPTHVSNLAYNERIIQLREFRLEIKALRARRRALDRIAMLIIRMKNLQLENNIVSKYHVAQLELASASRAVTK